MKRCKALFASAVVLWAVIIDCHYVWAAEPMRSRVAPPVAGSIWAHENLVAWEVAPFDPAIGWEERAQLLKRLGFKYFAYDWHEKDVPDFDSEIAAHRRQGIDILGWWFPLDLDDPSSHASFAAIRRHGIHPQLWVPHASFYFLPKSSRDWAQLWPKDSSTPVPKTWEDFNKLSEADRKQVIERWHKEHSNLKFPRNPREQRQRVRQEAERIGAIAKRAALHESSVALYNHGGWFGIMENQLAIIEELSKRGITNVGMVYFFAHARDGYHDDSKNFAQLWPKIKPHVVAIGIAGVRWEGQLALPSQGDGELEMMRIIQQSGWQGPVVLSADFGAETTLRNYITGLHWLAAEINSPGSGGPRPFPLLPIDKAH